jgi:pimeloyl-ACP methyl ester carboxylesterase
VFAVVALVLFRAAGVGFVLARVAGLAGELRLDPTKAGVIGDSFGGATAAVAAAQDPRVRAASDVDGALYGAVWEERLTVPFLLIESDCGETGHGDYYLDGTATLLGNLAAPGWRYQVARANHFSFSDAMLFFSAPARAAVALVLGGGRGPVATQRTTADLLDAFLRGPLDGRPASIEAVAARHQGVSGGRVR